MQADEIRYDPGQIRTGKLRCDSTIVAIEGALRVRYRDGSLNWLLDAVPVNDLLIREGEQYRLPCDAFVEITAAGKTAAVGSIEPALTALGRCAAWIVGAVTAGRRRQRRTERAPIVSRRSNTGT